MKKRKNKFMICGFIPVIAFVLALFSVISYYFFWNEGGPDQLSIGSIIFVSFMLLMLPILFIWSVIVYWPVVRIDEKGLHKALFGIVFKRILWDDLKGFHVKRNNFSFTPNWVTFTKRSLAGVSDTKRSLMRDKIFLIYSPELETVIKYYTGKNIAELEKSFEMTNDSNSQD